MVPDATVVVCTRDRPAQLETCLDSLAAQHHPPLEILVVDNGASEAVADICRARRVACIRESIPGLTRARNLGARAARGEIVAYIDDDAMAEPAWLDSLVREFADPEVAAVAGRTRYMTAWDGLRMTQDDAPGEPGPRVRQAFDRSTRGWFAQACFGRIGDGNTMAFRRSVLTDAVRFDERLGRGRLLESGDEHVAFMSLISDGYRVVHAPEAVVRHPMPGEPGLRQAKRLRDLRASFAYMIFLWFQFPTHRGDISRFLAQGLRRRAGGSARVVPTPTRLSTFQVLGAAWSGVRVYLKARREWLPGDGLANQPAPDTMPRVVTIR